MNSLKNIKLISILFLALGSVSIMNCSPIAEKYHGLLMKHCLRHYKGGKYPFYDKYIDEILKNYNKNYSIRHSISPDQINDYVRELTKAQDQMAALKDSILNKQVNSITINGVKNNIDISTDKSALIGEILDDVYQLPNLDSFEAYNSNGLFSTNVDFNEKTKNMVASLKEMNQMISEPNHSNDEFSHLLNRQDIAIGIKELEDINNAFNL